MCVWECVEGVSVCVCGSVWRECVVGECVWGVSVCVCGRVEGVSVCVGVCGEEVWLGSVCGEECVCVGEWRE